MSLLTVEAAANDIEVKAVNIKCHLGITTESDDNAGAAVYQAVDTALSGAEDSPGLISVQNLRSNDAAQTFDFSMYIKDPKYVEAATIEQAVFDFINSKTHEKKHEDENPKFTRLVQNYIASKGQKFDIRTTARFICIIHLNNDPADFEATERDKRKFQQINTVMEGKGDNSISILNIDSGDQIVVSVAAKSAENAESILRTRLYEGKANTPAGTVRSDTSDKLQYERKEWKSKRAPRLTNERVRDANDYNAELIKMFQNQPSFLNSFVDSWNMTLARMEQFVHDIKLGKPVKTTGHQYGDEVHAKASNMSYVTQKALAYEKVMQDTMFNYVLRAFDPDKNVFDLDESKVPVIREKFQVAKAKFNEALKQCKTQKERHMMRTDSTEKQEFDDAMKALREESLKLFEKWVPEDNSISNVLQTIAKVSNENAEKAANAREFKSVTQEEKAAIDSKYRGILNALQQERNKESAENLNAGGPDVHEQRDTPYRGSQANEISKVTGIPVKDLEGLTWKELLTKVHDSYQEAVRDEIDRPYQPLGPKMKKEPKLDSPISAITIDERGNAAITTGSAKFYRNNAQNKSVYVPMRNGAVLANAAENLATKIAEASRRAGVSGTYNDITGLMYPKPPVEGKAVEDVKISSLYEAMVAFLRDSMQAEGVPEAQMQAAVQSFDFACKNSQKPEDEDIKRSMDKLNNLAERTRAFATTFGYMDEGSAAYEGKIPPFISEVINKPDAGPEERIEAAKNILKEMMEHHSELYMKYRKDIKEDGTYKIPPNATTAFGENRTPVHDKQFMDSYTRWGKNLDDFIQQQKAILEGDTKGSNKPSILNSIKNDPADLAKDLDDDQRAEVFKTYHYVLDPLVAFIKKYQDEESVDVEKFNQEFVEFRVKYLEGYRLHFDNPMAEKIITDELGKLYEQGTELYNRFNNVEETNKIQNPDQGVPDTQDTPQISDVTPGQAADVVRTTQTQEENQQ